jgi:diadenosine tetraphosphate (Ap4A) HIT family hydrolase
MGEHQFYEGYAVVISKIHVREMHSMSQTVSNQLFNDVLNLGRAIDCAYKPLKINYASLGNIEEHLHWHIFPRYESDPNHKDNPWSNASEFGHHLTTPHHTEQVRLKLSPFLSP